MLTKFFNQANTQKNLLVDEIQKMKEFARSRDINYSNFLNYISICDWVIRRQEYNFIISEIDTYSKDIGKSLKILDIGCGVVPLCNRFSLQGHNVFAYDPIKADIEFIKMYDLNSVYGSNVIYAHGYGEELAFEDESFDVVYMASVLEHIPTGNDALVIQEALRVLKKGGLFVITTDVVPFYNSLIRSYAQAFDVQTLKPISSFFATAAGEDESTELFNQLKELTWEDVYTFWKDTKHLDRREDDIRHYLAVGFSFVKKNNLLALSSKERCSLLMHGESILIEDYYKTLHQAIEKESVIQEKERVILQLHESLAHKENLIESLQNRSIVKKIKNFIKGCK